MAYLTGPFFFTGSLGGIRSYYNRSLKRYVLSTKGGCSREVILNSPNFARTRENMSEFGGCSKWSSQLRRSLNDLRHLRDRKHYSATMSMAKLIQRHDAENAPGRSSISSSKAAAALPELNFNATHPFERVIYLNYRLTRDADLKRLRLTISSFRPVTDLHWPRRITSWRLTLVTALLPDFKWLDNYSGFVPAVEECEKMTRVAHTEWKIAQADVEDIELSTEIPLVVPETLLVVALGIEIVTDRSQAVESQGTMRILTCFDT